MKDVTAAIIIKEGKVLIARRALGENHAGGWEFPGGKIEPGETPEQCLKRELFEELSIDTKIKGFFAESVYEYSTGSIRLLAYFADILRGDIGLSVHDQIEWAEPGHLLDYNLLPADLPIAVKLTKVLL
jgi:8-oxo-dGTP diphosphatase